MKIHFDKQKKRCIFASLFNKTKFVIMVNKIEFQRGHYAFEINEGEICRVLAPDINAENKVIGYFVVFPKDNERTWLEAELLSPLFLNEKTVEDITIPDDIKDFFVLSDKKDSYTFSGIKTVKCVHELQNLITALSEYGQRGIYMKGDNEKIGCLKLKEPF